MKQKEKTVQKTENHVAIIALRATVVESRKSRIYPINLNSYKLVSPIEPKSIDDRRVLILSNEIFIVSMD